MALRVSMVPPVVVLFRVICFRLLEIFSAWPCAFSIVRSFRATMMAPDKTSGLELLPDLPPVGGRKSARSSGRSEGGLERRVKKELGEVELPGPLRADRIIRDGRACGICNRHDTDPDEAIAGIGYMYWGLKPKNGKTCGLYCGYCIRVWDAKFKVKFGYVITSLISKMGTDAAAMSEFLACRAEVVHTMKEAQS